MTRDLQSVLEELAERSGQELARHAPPPDVEVQHVAGRVVRRRVRHATVVGAGVTAVLAVGGFATQWVLAPGPTLPAVEPSRATSSERARTPSTPPTPAPAPTTAATSSAGTTAPPATSSGRPALVVGTGAAVDHLGAGADVTVVSEHLTALFGGPPEVTPLGLCPAGQEPGEVRRWGNLSLLVRTDLGTVVGADFHVPRPQDAEGGGPWRQVDIRTTEGVRVGDTLSTVRAAYPDAEGGARHWFDQDGRERVDGPPYFWSVGELPDSYTFVTEATDLGSPVTAIVSGYDCGE